MHAALLFFHCLIYLCMYFIGTELCVYLHWVIIRVWAAAEKGMTIKQPQATSGELTLWKWPWDKQTDLTDGLLRERGRDEEVLNFRKWKCFELKK